MENEQDHSQKPWIVALLILATLGIIGIFSLYLYQITLTKPAPTANPVPLVSDEQAPPPSPIEPTAPNVEPTTPTLPTLQRFKATYGFPAFSYLSNWHIAYLTGSQQLYLSPQPIGIINGSDAPIAPISVRIMEEGEAFLAAYEDSSYFSEYVSSSVTVGGKTAIRIDAIWGNNALRAGQKFTAVYVGGYELLFNPSLIETTEEQGFNTLLTTIQLN